MLISIRAERILNNMETIVRDDINKTEDHETLVDDMRVQGLIIPKYFESGMITSIERDYLMDMHKKLTRQIIG